MPQNTHAPKVDPISSTNWLQRLVRGTSCAILWVLLASGCITKSPQPENARQTARAQPSQPKAKRPLLVSALSWMGSIPTLSPRKPKPPPAHVLRLIGVIKMVDKDDRFVLIDATTFQAAEAGDLLVCIMDQKETANLRMSSLKNPPFLIADIASGSPSPGDRVFKP